MKHSPVMAFIVLVLCASCLYAEADKDTWKKYNALKDDSDYFVGEGVAKVAEFNGDEDKAVEAAKERAREDLGRAVAVEVKSMTSEKIESGPTGISEELKTEGHSASQVKLENVKTREFKGFPSDGKITVLAYLSKEDYRRQLAGKSVQLYRPERGLRIIFGQISPRWLEDFANWSQLQIQSTLNNPQLMNATRPSWTGVSSYNLGVEAFWRDFVLGLSYSQWSMNTYAYGGSNPQLGGQFSVTALSLQAGYDWTPWAWRLQPYLPLRLEATNLSSNFLMGVNGPIGAQSGGYTANEDNMLFGALIGLGLRYWPFDSLAFDVCYRQHEGFGGSSVNVISEQKSGNLGVSLNSWEWQVSTVWSGF